MHPIGKILIAHKYTYNMQRNCVCSFASKDLGCVFFFIADELEEDVEEQDNDKKGKYIEFWKQYSKFIKMGILDDSANGKRLAKLVRFQRYASMHDDLS